MGDLRAKEKSFRGSRMARSVPRKKARSVPRSQTRAKTTSDKSGTINAKKSTAKKMPKRSKTGQFVKK